MFASFPPWRHLAQRFCSTIVLKKEQAMRNVTQRLVAAAFIQRDIVAVAPDDTLRDALALMERRP
jgi:CBS-domain-containing membrane protein